MLGTAVGTGDTTANKTKGFTHGAHSSERSQATSGYAAGGSYVENDKGRRECGEGQHYHINSSTTNTVTENLY